MPAQRVDQLHRLAGRAEPADQHGRAVRDAGDARASAMLGASMPVGSRPAPRRRSPGPRRGPGRPRCRWRRRPSGARRSRSTLARVPRIRPPDAPSGWPMAIAPPRVLTISGSMSQASMQASDCTANASLSSTAPTSAQPMPARASALFGRLDRGVAEALRLQRVRRPPGDPGHRVAADAARPPSRSRAARADAPSLSGEALPAVIVPSGRNDGFSAASFSAGGAGADALVPGRARRPAPASRGRRRSRRPRPRRRAGASAAANASCRSREMP